MVFVTPLGCCALHLRVWVRISPQKRFLENKI